MKDKDDLFLYNISSPKSAPKASKAAESKYGMTNFGKDIARGKIGERIFKEDFLDFLDIHYQDVTGCQQFQVIDTDFLTMVTGYIEVKSNYQDNDLLVIEEYTNLNKEFGPISFGWFYKTKAKLLACVSEKTRNIILVPLTERFRNYYKVTIFDRDYPKLIKNKPTYSGNKKWQRGFRLVPFKLLSGYLSVYHKK